MNDLIRDTLTAIPKHQDSPYVFYHNNGEPFINVRKSFDKLLKTCKISKFRFHDMRHTYASQLAMSGVDLNTIRELLGHKSLQMTLRYAHLSPDHKRRAVDSLNRIGTNMAQMPSCKSNDIMTVSQLIDNK
jgi:integrase